MMPWDGLTQATFDIRLTVRGPIISQSTGMREPGLDSVFARDAAGRPILPGPLVGGLLREAWNSLAAVLPQGPHIPSPGLWLGESSGETDGDNVPARRRLVIADFTLADSAATPRTRTRIARDAKTRATTAQALQVIEDVAPLDEGRKVVFTGTATAIAATAALDDLAAALRVGLGAIPQLGAHRGVGFGVLEAVCVNRRPSAAVVLGAPPSAGTPMRLQLLIHPGGPLLFNRPRRAKNVFESEIAIPGGALKGALAELAKIDGGVVAWGASSAPNQSALYRHFERIRFGHAFPARRCHRRPVQWPLSLCVTGDGRRLDAALRPPPAATDGRTAEFTSDWKPKRRNSVADAFGWAAPARDLRVRTAFDSVLGRAQESLLFAYETVQPFDDDGHDLVWYGFVDLSDIPDEADRGRVAAELADLLARFGLPFLGKTKAFAEAWLLPANAVWPAADEAAGYLTWPGTPPEPCWAITLQTDAVLIASMDLQPGANADSLEVAYSKIWHDLSGGKLRLLDYFAQQKLAGGGYIQHRFLKRTAAFSRAYEPIALTTAGSVFVLGCAAGTDVADAAVVVDKFRRQGLKLPVWARERYARADTAPTCDHELWDTLPYIRQNGYGEVAVNLLVPDSAEAT